MHKDLETKLRASGYVGKIGLEELIEACGEGLNVMERGSSGWQVGIQRCEPYEGCWLDICTPNGDGPELSIAVANLWLAMNSK